MTVDASSNSDPGGKTVRPGAPGREPREAEFAQRSRLIAAAVQLLRERPVEKLSIAAVCAGAGISRPKFSACFADRNELLLATFDDCSRRVGAGMELARRGEATWLDGVRAALIQLLCLLDEDQGLAHFLIAGSLAANRSLLVRRARAVSVLASALEEGAPPLSGDTLPAPFGGEAVVGAVAAILHARLLEEPMPELTPLRGSLMSVIVLPYLGVAAARGELARSLAPRPAEARAACRST